ncbi:hypothetical protein Afil01_20780 [Actinorhabdospora filicis]|uniref:AB hydrolase-1 domain-containing protein n=1 Tax=Actinorhabdospora filicis TaxID=1785913 RepID=A0A9W6W991_9ACTN|nr:alpha/beta fold hydrolase [Actinorhabdospora filicis]GLZ77271.1 hypothetical protein Afil01_20780 [Actinorhabdospora filicis]
MSFFDDPAIHPGFIAANRPRVTAAGLDPAAYERVTAAIGHVRDWPDVLAAAGAAEPDARQAALWHHFATIVPSPDITGVSRRAAELMLTATGGTPVTDDHPEEGFRGVLRGEGPLVVLVPGMNSSAVEFTGVADELLRHGLSVLAIDGPGQASAPGRWQPEFERVVTRAMDAVGAATAGVWAMSMGGWLGLRAAAHQPRVRALVAVSGPAALDYDAFVPYVAETFDLRTGGRGREFAASVDASSLTLGVPVRVVEGGRDAIPGVTPLTDFGRRHDGLLVVEEGNHLIEEHRDEWLPQTAAWLRTAAA